MNPVSKCSMSVYGLLPVCKQLAEKPVPCLEYIVVHELAHLIERHHNDRFAALMDRRLPAWRQYRAELEAAPLAHLDWTY
jgi:predicted metal-dependent hydrolase